MMKYLLLPFAILLFVLISCNSKLKPDYRLNDIWALEEMDGEKVSGSKFNKGVPTIELHLKEGKVYGHGGCNEYSGKMTMGKGNLSIGSLMSTKMACPALKFESQFTSSLSENTLSYKLKAGKLYLSNERHQLIFKKVD